MGRARDHERARGASLAAERGSLSYHEIITIEPGKRGGQPCIRGMRITVSDALSYLALGMTEDELLSDFPNWRVRTSTPA